MSDIGQFSHASFLENVINLSWRIVLSKLIETIVKELNIVFMNIEGRVCAAESTSSVIAKPDIVTLIGEYN